MTLSFELFLFLGGEIRKKGGAKDKIYIQKYYVVSFLFKA